MTFVYILFVELFLSVSCTLNMDGSKGAKDLCDFPTGKREISSFFNVSVSNCKQSDSPIFENTWDISKYIFMKDSTPAHRAKKTTGKSLKFLTSWAIAGWDINPIKNMWHVLYTSTKFTEKIS